MEQILNQILGELKGLNEGQGRLETRMDSLGTKVDGLETKVGDLETKMDGFDSRMDSFDTKLENLEKGQERLESKVNALDEKVEAVDKKVDQLHLSLVRGLEPYFMNVEKHIDSTNEKTLSILQQQQNSIDILSARSIRHEADIKSINQLLRNQ